MEIESSKKGDPPGGMAGRVGVRHGVDEAPVPDAGPAVRGVFKRTKTPQI